ncbi:LysR substrate-binding domain-containing protein [Paludibaculum fermentans]|uniref:LysR substrate-binding domain-containing protein n=1 Tax=Paludibaculum fermentans TaxID=1473598 RepID=UPI003EBE9B9A
MGFKNLDLDTLRSLAVATDLGGYGHAANRLGRSASAISLQMKRLQDDVGAALFQKSGRHLRLTEAGELTLRFGRRMLALNDELLDSIAGAKLTEQVRLGFSQDFAETVLPSVLSRFSRLYPNVVLEVRIEGNRALADAVESGKIDLALVLGEESRPAAQLIGSLDLVWIAGGEYAPKSCGGPLPLILLGPQCAFRKEAVKQLDAAGIEWRISATSPSLAGLWASAKGGLGLTVRTQLALPPELVADPQLFGLPKLKPFPVTLQMPQGTSEVMERLAAIVSETFTEAVSGLTWKRSALVVHQTRRRGRSRVHS